MGSFSHMISALGVTQTTRLLYRTDINFCRNFFQISYAVNIGFSGKYYIVYRCQKCLATVKCINFVSAGVQSFKVIV